MLIIREKRNKAKETADLVFWSGLSFIAGMMTMFCAMAWFMRG